LFDGVLILRKGIENIDHILEVINTKQLSESRQSSAERLMGGYLLLCQSLVEGLTPLKDLASQEFGLTTILTDIVLNSSSNNKQRK